MPPSKIRLIAVVLALLCAALVITFWPRDALRSGTDVASESIPVERFDHDPLPSDVMGSSEALDSREPLDPAQAGMQEGTVVLVTEGGREVTTLWGELTVRSSTDEAEEAQVRSVRNGRWSCSARAGSQLEFLALTLEGRPCVIETTAAVAGREANVRVRARFAFPPLLHVVDRDTGAELGGLSIAMNEVAGSDCLLDPPSSARLLGDSFVSPIPLPNAGGTVTYWAKAKGYPWKSITVCHQYLGDRCLALDRACPAVIEAQGCSAGTPHKLRLYHDDRAPNPNPRQPPSELAWEGEIAGGERPTHRLELPRGSWSALLVPAGDAPNPTLPDPVSFQTSSATPQVIALECSVESLVAPQATSDVSVELVGEAEVDLVSACTLRRVKQEGLPEVTARAERRHMQVVPSEQSRSLFFNYGPMPVGEYELVIEPVQQRHRFVVNEGLSSLQTVLLLPVRAWSVSMQEETSGEALRVASAMWGPLHGDALTGGRVNPETGRIEFRSTDVEVDFLVWLAAGNVPMEVSAVLDPVLEVQRVVVKPPTAIRIQLADQGARVPMRSSWWHRIAFTDGEGNPLKVGVATELTGKSSFAVAALYTLPRGGPVRVELPALDDYAGAYTRQVDAVEGRVRTITMDLKGAACAGVTPR